MNAMPQKTREMHNHHIDSTVWNDIKFRDDDIQSQPPVFTSRRHNDRVYTKIEEGGGD